MLLAGTTVNRIFTYKFVSRLPQWTKVDISGEEAPPAPYETMTHEMLDDRGAHESMFRQQFVSPAVLEANEAGAMPPAKFDRVGAENIDQILIWIEKGAKEENYNKRLDRNEPEPEPTPTPNPSPSSSPTPIDPDVSEYKNYPWSNFHF